MVSPESFWANITWSKISDGSKPPHQAAQGGRTKGAAHPAAHLGGNADGVAVLVAHDHRLHAVAVRQTPQVLDGAVQLGHLLPLHLGHGQDAALA